MLALLILTAVDPAALLATAREKTAAERACVYDADATDITVCGLRNADRFRVPFVGYEPGDPRGEGVAAERLRLLGRTDACQEKRAIMVGCGSFGLHMTTNGSGTNVMGNRKLAP
ncbi:hypothetical protein Q5H91_13795 [Sphingomonas sp. KR1UV-12]|uniref:Uncharacterized protein n=1 Tax=Sphingomonas aurea TaxID=3063994 RepID=A0ABT9EMV9_9SPHN|nr:hypothetical protein [Sphingomonas sp. KR1UV-12]MDP1028293.1 hypothetical protein [Sphingomonas sp. KR1UV-12]